MEWPKPPDLMSITALTNIEACPRRWALATASYPDIWGQRGYPERPNKWALFGRVVHLALRTVTNALLEHGCPTANDPSAVSVLRLLGGHSKILTDAIEKTVESYASNPRAVTAIEEIRRLLLDMRPQLRHAVQSHLAALEFPTRRRSSPAGGGSRGERVPLQTGTYAEITLVAKDLGWTGRVDLIALSSDRTAIIEFKSGEAVADHELQLRVYALLWYLDRELNPSSSRASTLVLSYASGRVELPTLTDEDLRTLEAELRRQTESASLLLAAIPPTARPGADKCPTCQVRHMCDVYWEACGSSALDNSERDPTFPIDCALRITGPRDSFSWEAIVEACPGLEQGTRVLVRGRGPNRQSIAAGHVRALSARMERPDAPEGEDVPPFIVFDHSTEVFWLKT